jgi:hypothetical protein
VKPKTPPAEPGKRGPKTQPIDWELVARLSELQCTQDEIAHASQTSVDTLANRAPEEVGQKLSDYMKTHAQNGKTSLRRMQWKSASGGNIAMQIWLGKQYLAQTDKMHGAYQSNVNVSVENEVSELLAWFKRLEEKKEEKQ